MWRYELFRILWVHSFEYVFLLLSLFIQVLIIFLSDYGNVLFSHWLRMNLAFIPFMHLFLVHELLFYYIGLSVNANLMLFISCYSRIWLASINSHFRVVSNKFCNFWVNLWLSLGYRYDASYTLIPDLTGDPLTFVHSFV